MPDNANLDAGCLDGNLAGVSWMEVMNPDAPVGRVRHALFDFDGTISVIRRGWEQVMIPLMVEMIRGDSAPSGPAQQEIREEVADYVDRSTGILTIKQMEWLEEAVRRHGLTADVKTALEYKRIYNERLLEPVNRRISTRNSESREHLMIRGAKDFLIDLRERNVRLYLASGTDHPYVVGEADVLGVDGLFEGRIYGARDDDPKMTKERVIREILDTNRLSGEELAVFGDGPVEIRNAKERDALAVGIAADEERRSGLDPKKRRRVMTAGADIIVTDFSHHSELASILTGR